ncbi:MAG: SCO family protein [Alphaproteobacteria bacterium]|nr:SCO family protein [Alphaproteobacteria bacterium]
MRRITAVLGFALGLLAAGGAGAAPAGFPDLDFDPHPGARLPLEAALADEQDRPAPLGRYFGGAPVVLVLDYLRCASLCGLTLQTIVAALATPALEAGRDFQLVAVSIDPRDRPADAAAAKAKYLAGYRRFGGEDAMHFLTGSPAAVRRIADTVGFPYRYDAELDQYLHPAGFVVAAPDGRISRYLFGVGAAPAELQSALAAAKQGRALDPLTRLVLLCHIGAGRPGGFAVPIEAAFILADIAAIGALLGLFAAIRRRR